MFAIRRGSCSGLVLPAVAVRKACDFPSKKTNGESCATFFGRKLRAIKSAILSFFNSIFNINASNECEKPVSQRKVSISSHVRVENPKECGIAEPENEKCKTLRVASFEKNPKTNHTKIYEHVQGSVYSLSRLETVKNMLIAHGVNIQPFERSDKNVLNPKDEQSRLKFSVCTHAVDKHFSNSEVFSMEHQALGLLVNKIPMHPNLMNFIAIDSTHQIIRYSDCGASFDELRKGSYIMPPGLYLDAMIQCALGLKHLHEHGLVHCDVKPANLALASTGRVRFIDFGLLQATDSWERRPQSPYYLAPELVEGDVYAHSTMADFVKKADIYALGLTMIELLPFLTQEGLSYIRSIKGTRVEKSKLRKTKARFVLEDTKQAVKFGFICKKKLKDFPCWEDQLNPLLLRMISDFEASPPSIEEIVEKLKNTYECAKGRPHQEFMVRVEQKPTDLF